MSEPVRYRVRLARPHAHLIEVEAAFPAAGDTLTVALPVWTPGSYLVREFARHLQELTATDEHGEPLALTRVDKSTFQVQTRGRGARLRYAVYANELTVRTSHYDGTHAYFNGATVFLYAKGLTDRRHQVRVDAPRDWSTFCALDSEDGEWIAPSYDDLVDSPFEVGPHRPLEFSVNGVPHQVVIWGDGQLDRERLIQDVTKACQQAASLFGELPLRRYVFFLYLTDKGRGGLEHKASTALLYPRAQLTNVKGWEDLLTLATHEYFHLWNVKRIRPKALVPFDYSKESYTQTLWAFEGVTSYYDNLLVRRSGLMSAQRYLMRQGESLTSLHGTPGRRVQTLTESSLTTWIKHYRPDENSPNSAISYYLKGELVALLLDLEIRRATRDRASLDDVMRAMWKRYGDERGVPEDGFERVACEVAGKDLTAFFDRALRSTEELDYSPLTHVGLEVRYRVRESVADKGGSPPRLKTADLRPKGWLGILVRGQDVIATVLDGSPAMEAGLYADDQVIALDGFKVDGSTLLSRCEERKPGEVVHLTLFRREKLLTLPVTLGPKPVDALYIAKVDNPTDAQKAAYQAWLGASYDEPVPA